MKKSTAVLTALLSLFAGAAGGMLIGFLFAPIKEGFNFKFVLSECGNKNIYKVGGKGQPENKIAPEEKIVRLAEAANKKEKKGKGKWIGRK